jgi:hypothetical protein
MNSDNELYNEFEKLCLDITFERFLEIIDRLCNIKNENPVTIDELRIAINKINNEENEDYLQAWYYQ